MFRHHWQIRCWLWKTVACLCLWCDFFANGKLSAVVHRLRRNVLPRRVPIQRFLLVAMVRAVPRPRVPWCSVCSAVLPSSNLLGACCSMMYSMTFLLCYAILQSRVCCTYLSWPLDWTEMILVSGWSVHWWMYPRNSKIRHLRAYLWTYFNVRFW